MSRVNKKAFTMIELMLAMSFLSVLLIAISMTVIQISNIYNHGLTLKDVNQAGLSIASELQNSINDSTANDLTDGDYYVENKQSGTVWGGRLCTGNYTYVWNYGAAFTKASRATLNLYSDGSSKEIRFLKVPDSRNVYCTKDGSGVYPQIEPADAVELLDIGQHNLAIHQFRITTNNSASDSLTGQRLYNIEFVIGTNYLDALNVDQQSCRPPNDEKSDQYYCSVNQFNITVRAGRIVK